MTKILENQYVILVRPRRPRDGDPAVLVADSSQARSELGWNPRFDELSSIVSHAWNWEKRVDGIQNENK